MLIPFYKLVDKKVVKCDLKEYIEFVENNDLKIKKTTIRNVLISTVFLGTPSKWPSNAVLVFETMIFGGKFNNSQWKTETYEDAIKQHDKACDLVING